VASDDPDKLLPGDIKYHFVGLSDIQNMSYKNSGSASNARPFSSSSHMNLIRSAFGYFSSITGYSFSETNNFNEANIRLSHATISGDSVGWSPAVNNTTAEIYLDESEFIDDETKV